VARKFLRCAHKLVPNARFHLGLLVVCGVTQIAVPGHHACGAAFVALRSFLVRMGLILRHRLRLAKFEEDLDEQQLAHEVENVGDHVSNQIGLIRVLVHFVHIDEFKGIVDWKAEDVQKEGA